MAEQYGFFNSTEDDIREYTASQFAEYFSRFLSDGLYTENGQAGLRVNPGTGLSVNVATGYAYVRGYMYKNDAVLTKEIEPADPMLERIDRIVLKFDEVAREIKIEVKKGNFSSTPVAPGIINNSTVKELTLARVRVRKGATSISTNDITDERFLPTCGFVSSLIDIPAEEMWTIWNASLSDIEANWNTEKNSIIASWNAWFENRQSDLGIKILSGSTEPEGLLAGDIWLKEL
jgi:hypothetical protein